MKKPVLALLALALCSFAPDSFSQEFEADMVNTTRGGVYNAHVNVGKDKMRVQTDDNIVISRMDKGVTWMLVPAQKIYMEQAIDPKNMQVTSEKVNGEVNRQRLGAETINGVKADKYKVTYNVSGMEGTMYQWIAPSLNMPLRSEAGDGSWTVEYTNIKAGPQDASLFEIPAGYNKMDMYNMGDLMKGMTNEEE
ncbi:MAG: hypothetical protein PHE80_02125 [Candidatus Omnitrophica bacterium]|nr:hypothetical protein [Candidatus Omnitrophota bacterium]MDD5736717.1 hypothetical protein [Candidatus Omnitrophota bacterium]